MNAVLDSQFEALAINYVRFGFFAALNNLWTWVAAFTAAVSLWRIRAGSSAAGATMEAAVSCSSEPEDQRRPSVKDEGPCPIGRFADVPAALAVPSAAVSGGCGLTKGRFTAYYDGDGYGVDREMEDDAAEIGTEDGGGSGGLEWWEGVLGVRNGDLGWYRCQDLTVLDGSVVRLWDDARLIRRRR